MRLLPQRQSHRPALEALGSPKHLTLQKSGQGHRSGTESNPGVEALWT